MPCVGWLSETPFPLETQQPVVHLVDALAAGDTRLTQSTFVAHANLLHDAVRGHVARIRARADAPQLRVRTERSAYDCARSLRGEPLVPQAAVNGPAHLRHDVLVIEADVDAADRDPIEHDGPHRMHGAIGERLPRDELHGVFTRVRLR